MTTAWPMVSLKECCSVVGGATPRRDNAKYWGGSIPWVTPKDISNLDEPYFDSPPEYITQAGYDSAATYLVPAGTVLLTSRAPIGNLAIAGREMCTNQGFKSLVPGENVDSSYLFWCMKRFVPKLQAVGNGATFKEVSKAVVEQFEIPLPPMPEQKRIAAILDKADAIRRKRQQAIQLADEFLRSVFLEMFGDPVTNPKAWNKVPLKELVSKVVDCPHSTPRWTESGKIAIRTSNLTVGGWSWDDTRYVNEEEFVQRSSRAFVAPGDVVLSREGTVGIAAIVQEGMEICLGQRLVQLKPDSEKALSEYLLHVLLYELAPARIKRVMVGATSKHINVRELKEMEIPQPPLTIQQDFERIVAKVNEFKRRLELDYELSADLFGSLSQRAFQGGL